MLKFSTAAIVAFFFCSTCFALTPDQIVLVANANVPASVELAKFYADQRHLPAGRIVELKLPVTEEMPYDTYEQFVLPPVREFLAVNHLQKQITCLVTFRGVPIRIGARVNTPHDREELSQLQTEEKSVEAQILAAVTQLEDAAKAADPIFTPTITGTTGNDLARRANAAMSALPPGSGAAAGPIETLGGKAATFNRTGQAILKNPAASQEDRDKWQSVQAKLSAAAGQLPALEAKRWDADSREKLRQLVRENFGLFTYARVINAQVIYFSTEDTAAALDSELALLWWPNYQRTKWQFNPLFYKLPAEVRSHTPPTLMVMRLDAPRDDIVRRIITDSIAVESTGLKGKVVLDSRGLLPDPAKPEDAFARYDKTIRNLANIVSSKTHLQLVDDELPAVLPAHSANDVAVYCGWYSVNNYIPSCQFAKGAVGFHIASYEMVSLADSPNNHAWVPNLLKDGIDATLGPVAEPYLHAFPAADDFFPLLLTGKLTLAEVYWRTNPLTSWMISMIGDPLYTPYKSNPALAMEDLPPRLEPAVTGNPSTQPEAFPLKPAGPAGR